MYCRRCMCTYDCITCSRYNNSCLGRRLRKNDLMDADGGSLWIRRHEKPNAWIGKQTTERLREKTQIYTGSWKIWKSVGMRNFPIYGNRKLMFQAPTSCLLGSLHVFCPGNKHGSHHPILVALGWFSAKRSTGKPKTVLITGQVITWWSIYVSPQKIVIFWWLAGYFPKKIATKSLQH